MQLGLLVLPSEFWRKGRHADLGQGHLRPRVGGGKKRTHSCHQTHRRRTVAAQVTFRIPAAGKGHGLCGDRQHQRNRFDEKRLCELQGLVDWFKISLPAADEETMTRLTGDRSAWRPKWEALGFLEKYGCKTDILTVMTSENIRRFDDFLDLLEPHELLYWKPLRGKPGRQQSPGDTGRDPHACGDTSLRHAAASDGAPWPWHWRRRSAHWRSLRRA